MRIIVIIMLLLGAQLGLTAFAPAAAGRAWLLWPFAADAQRVLSGIGGLPQQSGSTLTPLLAGVSGLAFLAAALGLLGWGIPANWWLPAVLVATVASIALHVLYIGPWAVLPLAVDAALLWGVFAWRWSAASMGLPCCAISGRRCRPRRWCRRYRCRPRWSTMPGCCSGRSPRPMGAGGCR